MESVECYKKSIAEYQVEAADYLNRTIKQGLREIERARTLADKSQKLNEIALEFHRSVLENYCEFLKYR